ncbi:MAG: hypothetical protein PHR28_12960 [candidate division Zixibacteria bacterium]|jgi:hypothetical protein|nr:hypothetical protein [candidate division Zixibacteria bacterium]
MDLDEYRRRRYLQRYGPLAERAIARNREQVDLIRLFGRDHGLDAGWSIEVRRTFVREWEAIEHRYSDLPPTESIGVQNREEQDDPA